MRRTAQFQGLRLMKFEEVYERPCHGALSQGEAAEILDVSERPPRPGSTRLGQGLFDDRLDVVTPRLDVDLHGLARTFDVPISDAIKYRQMLSARALDALIDLEVENPEDREPVVDQPQLVEQDLVVDGACQGLVKLPIEPGHFFNGYGRSLQNATPRTPQFVQDRFRNSALAQALDDQ